MENSLWVLRKILYINSLRLDLFKTARTCGGADRCLTCKYNSGHVLEHASKNISDRKMEENLVNHQSHVLANQPYSCNVSGLRVSDSLVWQSISTESQLSFMDSISMLVVRVFLFLRSCKHYYIPQNYFIKSAQHTPNKNVFLGLI